MSDLLPVGLAAGMWKSHRHVSHDLIGFIDHVTFGSYTLKPREGNKGPTYWYDDKTGNSINAVGLKNQGLVDFLAEDLPNIGEMFGGSGTIVRVSLAPSKTGDLARMCELIMESRYRYAIDEVEVNAACPNHRAEAATTHAVLAHDLVATEALMQETTELEITKAIKIAPRMLAETLKAYPGLAAKHSFSFIVSGNTLPGSATIDGVQRLSADRGGLAGAILRDDCVSQIRLLSKACAQYDEVHLIACGDINSAETLRANLDAGASYGQLATAYMQYGDKIFQNIAMGFDQVV